MAEFYVRILTDGFHLLNPVPLGGLEPLSNTVLLGATQVFLYSGISFYSVALTGCTNESDRQSTLRKVTAVAIILDAYAMLLEPKKVKVGVFLLLFIK